MDQRVWPWPTERKYDVRASALSLAAVSAALAILMASHAVMAQPSDALRRTKSLQLPDGAIASLPPERPSPAALAPLIVLLHGAGQTPYQMIARFEDDQDSADAVLLAPKSIKATWDIIAMAERRAAEGTSLANAILKYVKSPDGDRVISAIGALEARVAINRANILLIGFSDGATFALALGTGRDRPFTAVVAVAPGLAVVPARAAAGRPVIVMHGRSDRSLPFDFTRGTIVPALRNNGVSVRFVPFKGGHRIPDGVMATLRREFAPTRGDEAER